MCSEESIFIRHGAIHVHDFQEMAKTSHLTVSICILCGHEIVTTLIQCESVSIHRLTHSHKHKQQLKGCRMGRSDKVSLWYVPLLINTRFRFFILE